MIERIASIVRAARERESCSLEELADRTGAPIDHLVALDAGRPGVTTTQLEEVARALSLDPAALSMGRERTWRVPSVFLRHTPMQDFDERDASVLDEALEQGRSLANLRAHLSEPALALQAGTFPQHEAARDRPDAPAQEGYQLARAVRRWLGNTTEPIDDLGVLLEERFGIAVLVRTLASSRVTAAGVRSESCAAVVLSARDTQRARNPLLTRVYLSHELCHVLFDPSSGGLHIVLDGLTDRKDQAAEQRARAFAAELLLPLEGLVVAHGKPSQERAIGPACDLVARVRSQFGTPHDIAANHLCNQGFIDRSLREWLEAERTTFAGTPPSTTLPAVDAPSRAVASYVERAHRDDVVTDGEARAMLGLDRLAPLPWDEAEL